jgi:serine/threonine protein kinase
MAPEVFLGAGYTAKADSKPIVRDYIASELSVCLVFSLGMVLFEVMTFGRPYEEVAQPFDIPDKIIAYATSWRESTYCG